MIINQRWAILACAAMMVFFTAFPEVDLWFSNLFFNQEEGFYLADSKTVQVTYQLFARLHFIIVLALLVMLVIVPFVPHEGLRRHGKTVRFLFFLMLVGPGLLVNLVLKDNFNGRARPVQVQEFGGEQQFTSPFVIANQCERNCSFVSGHAAGGFYMMAAGWILGSRLWALPGFLLGVFVGACRILQGGHFLSDIIFSFWVMYFTILIFAWLYDFGWRNAQSRSLQPAWPSAAL